MWKQDLLSRQVGDQSQDSIYDVITEFKFNSELIHTSSVSQIMEALSETSMYTNIRKLVTNSYNTYDAPSTATGIKERAKIIRNIHRTAVLQITADGAHEFDMLTTAPLKHLKNKYSKTTPAVVIMGAKGSGKTFLYHKFVQARSWIFFCVGKSQVVARQRLHPWGALEQKYLRGETINMRLYILCEGQTEDRFVKEILGPYLLPHNCGGMSAFQSVA